jgi:putative RecB family exonuclease
MENSVRLSPSAISVFLGCQAKFYYRYIERLPEKPSVHQIRGRIIHKVLEVFFDTIDISKIDGSKHWHQVWEDFRKIIFELLEAEWKKIRVQGSQYADLFESQEQKEFFLQESKEFLDFFTVKLAYSLCNKSAELADDEWRELNLKKHFYPKHKEFKIELVEENIVGFIDKTLNLFGDGVAIVDYKTSKSTLPHFISESDLKQCKAYAWLWHKKFNELPRFISIFYVRDGESIYYPISERDLQEIENDIKTIRSKGREKSNFSKMPSRLCNYCDFFSHCFESREMFEKELGEK